MNATIQRRIEKLEKDAGSEQDRITVIIRFMVAPGIECPANTARFNDTVLKRAPDETEDEFIERVKDIAGADAGESCVRVIVFHDGDD